jgi:hypothetical protein
MKIIGKETGKQFQPQKNKHPSKSQGAYQRKQEMRKRWLFIF